jgi:signal transduction histidine kinase
MRELLNSLRIRLLVLMLLAMGPMLALVLYGYSQQMRAATAEAQAKALTFARLAANDQARLVEGARQLLVVLAQLPSVQNQDAAACSSFLAELLREYPVYENLGAVNLEGDIYCSAVPAATKTNVADRSWFQLALQTRDFLVGDYLVARITGRPALGTAYPVLDVAAQPLGVVFAGIDLAWLDSFVAQANLPEGSSLTVFDSAGIVLTRHPEPEIWRGTAMPDSVMEQLVAHLEFVNEEVGIDGIPRLYGTTRLSVGPTGDVFVRVGIPTSIVYADAQQLLVRNLVTLGLAGLLVFGAAWGLARVWLLKPLGALLSAIRRFEAGDTGARVGPKVGGGEMSHLGRAFDQLAATLEARKAERDRSEMALQEEQRARAALLEKTISAQEDERKRIARELHDQTSQDLAALMLSLDTCGLGLARGEPGVEQHLQTAKSIADTMLANTRRLINDLRPPLLDDLGLAAAIAWYAESRLEPLGIAVELRCEQTVARLAPALETALFRIAQEALTNVVRHADASSVYVTLAVDDHAVSLAVRDNGRGFRQPAVTATGGESEGLGLRGMRERVTILGGEMCVESEPERGTTITVTIPVSPHEKRRA